MASRTADDHHRRHAVVVDHAGRVPVDPDDPARLARGLSDDQVVQSGRGSVGTIQGEVGHRAPEHQPQSFGDRDPHRPGGEERSGDARSVARPQEDGQQPVDDDRAGSPVDRVGGSVEHSAEALADPPHPERPGDRGDQGRLQGGSPGDPETQRHLEEGEQGVGDHRMVADGQARPVDRCGQHVRIPGRHGGDHLVAECPGEEDRLHLEETVEEPERGQHQLQGATTVRLRPGPRTDRPGGGRRHPRCRRQHRSVAHDGPDCRSTALLFASPASHQLHNVVAKV